MLPSERLYRALLRLYPHEHRAAYGDLMLTHARDQWREAQGVGRWAAFKLWLNLLIDVLETAPMEHIYQLKDNPRERIPRLLVYLAGLVGLTFTWFSITLLVLLYTEGLLVPWDTAPGRPPVGTLARTINDFFEVGIGAWLPTILLVGGSVILFLRHTIRSERPLRLPWFFAGLNVAYIIGSMFVIGLVRALVERVLLPYPINGIDAGYHRTWLPLLVLAILSGVWLFAQSRIAGWGDENQAVVNVHG